MLQQFNEQHNQHNQDNHHFLNQFVIQILMIISFVQNLYHNLQLIHAFYLFYQLMTFYHVMNLLSNYLLLQMPIYLLLYDQEQQPPILLLFDHLNLLLINQYLNIKLIRLILLFTYSSQMKLAQLFLLFLDECMIYHLLNIHVFILIIASKYSLLIILNNGSQFFVSMFLYCFQLNAFYLFIMQRFSYLLHLLSFIHLIVINPSQNTLQLLT